MRITTIQNVQLLVEVLNVQTNEVKTLYYEPLGDTPKAALIGWTTLDFNTVPEDQSPAPLRAAAKGRPPIPALTNDPIGRYITMDEQNLLVTNVAAFE
jgi:hypothetical protein